MSVVPVDNDVLRTRLGQPIRGPSAFGGTLKRFVALTYTLAVTDFKLRFFGSVLGYLWQLIRPLMLFGVLYVVFTKVLRVGAGVPYYSAVLVGNIVLYTFWGEVTTAGVTCVADREAIVRKVQFPRLVIPLAVTLTALFNLALNLIAVAIFIAASGAGFHWTVIEAPLLLFIFAIFAAGVAMILAALYVSFRDVKPIWEVVTQALYFGTPILYPIEKMLPHAGLAHLVMSSPIAVVIVQFRHAVVDPSAPSASQAAGGWDWLLVPGAVWIGVVVFGVWFFNRQAPRIAEKL
jgi:ABC-2 type transport system permease protein